MDFRDEWDGYRAIATIDAGRVNLRSRNGLSLDSKYPPIVQELKRLKLKSAILDGEIAVLDSDGIPRFELLQRFQRNRKGELRYFVFDLLYLNGEDLVRVPLVRRREILKGSCRRRVESDSAMPLKGTGKSFSERHENDG
jgi:bifunctional non-homologous end joining protein LigD